MYMICHDQIADNYSLLCSLNIVFLYELFSLVMLRLKWVLSLDVNVTI